eukprot:3513849-Prymnesium_polylepis.1
MLCGVLAPMWLHMALGRLSTSSSTSGEGHEPPLSIVQRLGSAGVGGGGISVALYVCYNEFYENNTS